MLEKAHRVLGSPHFLVLLVLQLCSRISLKLGTWILVTGGGHLENPVTLGDPKVFQWASQVALSHFSRVLTVCDPWTVARQAPLPMGFSRQDYWSGLPFPLPGDLPDLGMELASLTSPVLAGGFFTTGTTWEGLAPWPPSFMQIDTILRSFQALDPGCFGLGSMD